MKSKLILATCAVASAMLLNSCATHKSSLTQRKLDAATSKEQDNACFVQWRDGSFDQFQDLELVTGMFKTPYLLADGKQKITADQITAYQNKKHYALSQSGFSNGPKSYVAVETLPGFAIRVAKGKFNVYSTKVHNGQVSKDVFFLQEGDKGHIFACTNEVMSELLEKDPESFDMVYSRMSYSNKSKKLQSIAALSKSSSDLTRAKK